MGGTTFETYAYGRTPKEAYEAAVADAIYEYGHQSYSGTIKEKDGYVLIDVPSKWKGKEDEYADHLIQESDRRISDKWGPAGCILLESKPMTEEVPYATTQERYDQKGARKWETYFEVISIGNFREEDVLVGTRTSQTEAEKFAKDYVKRNNRSVRIRIGKRLINGDQNIVTIHPKTKTVKSKHTMNKYLFFGWASC
jgi:hypothetical protein